MRAWTTVLDVVFILLIAGGIAMIYVPAGVIALGVVGISVSYVRSRR